MRRNILKVLHYDYIVQHHHRGTGILYILMEYYGGGDLSTIIKQATRQNRPLPEDTIWHYFLQIL
jgi:NIMA (never in mitosis gene a)-related kinase